VSKTNLLGEQEGINFTPFVLSLPYAKKNKNKNKIKFQKCLSVVCHLI
jgi:hypothetical protein